MLRFILYFHVYLSRLNFEYWIQSALVYSNNYSDFFYKLYVTEHLTFLSYLWNFENNHLLLDYSFIKLTFYFEIQKDAVCFINIKPALKTSLQSNIQNKGQLKNNNLKKQLPNVH